MRHNRITGAVLLLLISSMLATLASASEPALERELERLAAIAGGSMGVAVLHVESGRSAFVNADEPYPMASTYKVPLAVEVLSRVDDGSLSLDSMIDVDYGDYAAGSGMLAKLLDDPGLTLSVHNLLEIMLLISDNTATDVLMKTVGGGGVVTDRMRSLGIDGLRVDRSTSRLIGDYLGLDTMPSASGRRWEDFEVLVDELPDGANEAAEAAFEVDGMDTATPRAMADLLVKIWQRDALSEPSSALLIDIMERCETGLARLKGSLPPETVVAHKTGTIGRTTNDVGIVYLPGKAGHVVVAAFVKASDESVATRERAIAEVARAAHDYFLFATSGEAR